MKNENYLLTLHKIIPLWYEDVQPKQLERFMKQQESNLISQQAM